MNLSSPSGLEFILSLSKGFNLFCSKRQSKKGFPLQSLTQCGNKNTFQNLIILGGRDF
jgi:hypothetical protein